MSVFSESSQNDSCHFLEDLVYNHNEAVIMTGDLASYSDLLSFGVQSYNAIGFWWKPWFYQHAQKYLSKPSISHLKKEEISKDYVEFIPLRDYYHRHTRSIFWVSL